MKYNNIVGENLKNIRIRKGWSQEFVSRQLCISQRTISRAETGQQVSRRMLMALCSLYQIDVADVYKEDTIYESPKTKPIVSEDVALSILARNQFIAELENEVVIRFNDTIMREALLTREDLELIIPEALSPKKTYTMADVLTACMCTNQATLSKIRELAIA